MPGYSSAAIEAAHAVARKFGNTRVIMLLIDDEKGTYNLVTWGKNKVLCDAAKRFGDGLWHQIEEMMVSEAFK